MSELYEFKHLFTPFKIGKVEIKNRSVFQPHVPYYGSDDGYPTETTKRYYIERAKGGIGLIVIESLMVHPSGVYMPKGCIKMYNPGIVEAWKDFPPRIHEYGAKVFGQLSHAGANVLTKPHLLASAPSQMPDGGGRIIPKELDHDTILEIIEGFALAALKLKEAGFDGTELKFAHDGLLRAFSSPLLNQRDDEYGGSYENRLRFFIEIVQNIRKKCGPDFPIGVRLCLDEFCDGGVTQDYSLKLAKTCEEVGIDYINGDSGGGTDGSMQIFPMCMPLGAGVYMASKIKKAVHIPVVAFGRVNDPVLMEMILDEGHADLVGSARQFICDPQTMKKAEEGRLDDVRHCIACNDGCIYQCMQGKPIRCVQRPATGREIEMGIGTLDKVQNPKNIMVIGGGIAGMKFAEIAGKRGHHVTLYEKSDVLGGQMNLAEKLPFRAEISEVSRYIRLQLLQLPNVKLEMGVTVDQKMVEEINPDIVVVATGSKAFIPEHKIAEGSKVKVIDQRQALMDPGLVGNHVVVLDKHGHYQAAGITEFALTLGAKVHYMTPYERMGADIDPLTNTMLCRRVFEYEDFSYQPFTDLVEITDTDVVVQNVYSQRPEIIKDVNTFIYANYASSDNALYKALKKSGRETYDIGDCASPRLMEQVIYESEVLARKL